MGGTPELLKMFAKIIIGSYCAFHSTMMNIKALYKVKSDTNIFKNDDQDEKDNK